MMSCGRDTSVGLLLCRVCCASVAQEEIGRPRETSLSAIAQIYIAQGEGSVQQH
jgi:hypothetical protein